MLNEKGGSLVSKIRGLGKSIVYSTALAGSLLYSNPVYSQDLTPEQKQRIEERIKNIKDPAAKEIARANLEALFKGTNQNSQQKPPEAQEPKLTQEEIRKKLIEENKEQNRIEAEKRKTEAERRIREREEEWKRRRKNKDPIEPVETPQEPNLPETTSPIKQPKEDKVTFYTEKPRHFIWHSLGGPAPNGDLQGTRAYSGFDILLEDIFSSELLFTNKSLSYLDANGNRIIENSPFNGHGKLRFSLDNLKLEFGYTGNLEERISRETSEINQLIGSSAIQVITRNKTREVDEYHAGMFSGDFNGLRTSFTYFVNLFPTIRTHEIFQSVIDSSNLSSSFTSSDEF